MSCVIMPSTSGRNDGNKKVKKGGSSSFSARGFTTLLYVEVLPLFSVDPRGGCSFTRKVFANKYDLCYVGLSPKQVKIPRDCTRKDIDHKCFDLVVNKIGYQYVECSNPKFIANVPNRRCSPLLSKFFLPKKKLRT